MEKRQTNYEALYKGLEAVRNHLINAGESSLGIPKNMGCTLGGGDWRIVSVMLEVIFGQSLDFTLYICNYTPSPAQLIPIDNPFNQ